MQSALFCLVAVVLIEACSQSSAPRPHLSAAYGNYRRVDDTFTFELPDSAGYLVNKQPLDTSRLLDLLHEAFDQRKPYLRAAFLIDNPRRPWSDVEVLIRKTHAAGVQLFDAESSGRLMRGLRTVVDTLR